MTLRVPNSRFCLSVALIALVAATPVAAEEVSPPDIYAYDGGYFPSAGQGQYSSAVGMPFGTGYGATSTPSSPGYSAEMIAPGVVGPQVPPMPQMPSWVQAWAGEMSDAERVQLEDVYKGLRRINHALTGELMDAGDLIADTLKADARDPKSVGKAYARYFDVQRRWIEAQIAAANRVDELVAQVRERISQVPPPAVGPMGIMPPAGAGTGAISAPIVIPPAPGSEPAEVPPPGVGAGKH